LREYGYSLGFRVEGLGFGVMGFGLRVAPDPGVFQGLVLLHGRRATMQIRERGMGHAAGDNEGAEALEALQSGLAS